MTTGDSAIEVAAAQLVNEGATGVQVALSRPNRELVSVAAGVAQRGGPDLAPGAAFRAGSTTKLLIAIAVMRLVESHEVELNAPLSDYLGSAPSNTGAVTMTQLLNHTGGVSEYTRHLPLFAPGPDPDVPGPTDPESLSAALRQECTDDDITALIDRDPIDPSLIGSFSYSNANYQLLARVLTAVTAKPWRDHITSTILKPLGMTGSRLPGADPQLETHAAHGYQQLPSGPVDVSALNPSMLGAAGELISTVEDLVTLVSALHHRHLVTSHTYDLMCTQSVPTPPMADYGIAAYGLGVITLDTPHGPAYGAAGTVNGYATTAYASPTTNSIAAVSATQGSLPFLTMTRRIVTLTQNLLSPPDRRL